MVSTNQSVPSAGSLWHSITCVRVYHQSRWKVCQGCQFWWTPLSSARCSPAGSELMDLVLFLNQWKVNAEILWGSRMEFNFSGCQFAFVLTSFWKHHVKHSTQVVSCTRFSQFHKGSLCTVQPVSWWKGDRLYWWYSTHYSLNTCWYFLAIFKGRGNSSWQFQQKSSKPLYALEKLQL